VEETRERLLSMEAKEASAQKALRLVLRVMEDSK
jgi:hypothetical protein